MKRNVSFFVSYSHRNRQLAESFVLKLMDVLHPSRAYNYQLWMDTALVIGEEWEKQIAEARNRCDFGLLLVSPGFLGSKFISENELPYYTGEDSAPCIPVLLQPVDFQRHDLKGLQSLQIFRFAGHRFKEPRAYGECKGMAKDEFVLELFRAIEAKLSITESKNQV